MDETLDLFYHSMHLDAFHNKNGAWVIVFLKNIIKNMICKCYKYYSKNKQNLKEYNNKVILK